MSAKRYIALLAFAVAAACSPPANNGPQTAECHSDRDCTGDKVCRANICALEQTEPREFGFKLMPPPSSTFPPQSVPIRELESDSPVQIGLEPGVRVAGTLTYAGVELGPRSGRLKFNQLGGDDFSGETQVTDNEYEIFVPAGRYDVVFYPQALDRPTRVWRDVAIELDTNPRLQLVYELVEISGTLSRTDAVTREATFVPNARVFAISDESGVTSSTSVTSESGSFSLQVPRDSGAYDLYVAPSEPNAFKPEQFANYIPEAKFEDAFLVEESDWVNTLDEQQADLLGVSLGEYSYAPSVFGVRLAAELSNIDWTGTSVTLRTSAGRGRVSIRQRVDASGSFELPLVNGVYEVLVRTPPELPVASARFEQLDLKESGLNITLPLRDEVNGTVSAPTGAALAGAQLTFEPVGTSDVAERVTVVTDEDGMYTAWLDDSDYRLAVTPSDPQLPKRVEIISPKTFDGNVAIAEPFVVWGNVFSTPSASMGQEEWRDMPDVIVRVVEADGDSTRVIGEGLTNAEGQFRIFVETD